MSPLPNNAAATAGFAKYGMREQRRHDYEKQERREPISSGYLKMLSIDFLLSLLV
jgi:hypothetical protein